jgi:hypothetical protein
MKGDKITITAYISRATAAKLAILHYTTGISRQVFIRRSVDNEAAASLANVSTNRIETACKELGIDINEVQ